MKAVDFHVLFFDNSVQTVARIWYYLTEQMYIASL